MKRQLSRILIIFGLGSWVFAAGFMYFRSVKERSPEPVAPMVGHIAPDFELISISGQTIRLGNFQGHPVLVNFWATWCDYCLDELPVIEKYYERYIKDLVVLAVDVGDSLEEVRSVAIQYGFKFPVLRDPDYRVFENYRLDSFPVSFFLDENGIVLVKHVGYMSENKLVENLSKIGLPK